MQLALLGGGRMGEALLSGLLDAGWDADALAVAEVDPERRRLVEERFRGVRAVPSPAWAVAESDVVVLAVKPSDVGAALEQCLPSLKTDAMVLSIAAGVTLATLEEAVPDRPVVRAMPNTAALVRKGAAAIAGGRHATEAHLDEAERILGSVGVVVRVPEELLDAVTGLSGSGPAYVFLVAEALIDAIRQPEEMRDMAEVGRQLVTKRYDWDTLADRLDDTWRAAANERIPAAVEEGGAEF